MPVYSRHMTQTATYTPPAGQNGFGDLQYGTPVSVTCRWQDKADLFRDAQGREVVSSAVVYVAALVQIGGLLELAGSSDPREIRNVGQSPSLDGTETLIKVWL